MDGNVVPGRSLAFGEVDKNSRYARMFAESWTLIPVSRTEKNYRTRLEKEKHIERKPGLQKTTGFDTTCCPPRLIPLVNNHSTCYPKGFLTAAKIYSPQIFVRNDSAHDPDIAIF